MFLTILAEDTCNAIQWDKTSLCDIWAHCFAMTHAMGCGRGYTSRRQRQQKASEKDAVAEDAGREAESVPNGGAAEPICRVYNHSTTIEQNVDEIHSGNAALPVCQSDVQVPSPSRQVNLLPNGCAPFQVNALSPGMDALATDAKQKPQTHWKGLYQTGTGTAAVDTASIPTGGHCKSKTVLVVATITSVHANAFLEHDFGVWLNEHNVTCVEVRPRRMAVDGNIRMVVRIQSVMEDAFYKLCGRNGVATGTYLPVVIDSGKQPPLLNVIARGSEPIGGGRRLVPRRKLEREAPENDAAAVEAGRKADSVPNGGASLPVCQSDVQMQAPFQVNAFPANAQTSIEARTAPIPPWRAAPLSKQHLVDDELLQTNLKASGTSFARFLTSKGLNAPPSLNVQSLPSVQSKHIAPSIRTSVSKEGDRSRSPRQHIDDRPR